MQDITSLKGPVEKLGDDLVLRIPLEAGGDRLVECSKGIGEVHGAFLEVVIPTWLAEKLGITEGSWVSVDNANGKFNLRPLVDPVQ
jgi:hypothetical protein